MTLDEIASYLGSLDDGELESLCDSLIGVIPYDRFTTHSAFNFIADSGLEGGPFPCACFECREKKVDQLVRFSSLYADKVLIRSPIDQALNIAYDNDELIFELAFGILLIMKLEHVVKAGHIGFIRGDSPICESCLQKQLEIETGAGNKINSMWQLMIDDFCMNAKCILKKKTDGSFFVEINGMDAYVANKQMLIDFSYDFEAYSDIYYRKGSTPLSREEIIACGLPAHLSPILQDAIRALISPSIQEGSYLTNQPAQMRMLQAATSKLRFPPVVQPEACQLAIEVPFAKDATIESIVGFRHANEESFQVFRDSINKGLKEFGLHEGTLAQLENDVIQPEINKLKLSARNSRIKLFTHMGAECAVGVATMICANYGVFSPADVLSIFGASACTCIRDTVDHIKNPDVKNNPMYFLWKLSK